MSIVADPPVAPPTALCHLDRASRAPREAEVGVHYRGFMFGDGIGEMVPVIRAACSASTRTWRVSIAPLRRCAFRTGVGAQLRAQAGMAFTLRDITREEVFVPDKLLLSSADEELLPVAQLDGQPIVNGRPGPIYERLYAPYRQAKQKGIA